MSEIAHVELDKCRYGLSDRRRPRYAFHIVDKDGSRSLMSARYEGVLLAVSDKQLDGWKRAKIVRTALAAQPLHRRLIDAWRTRQLERSLRRATMSAS